MTTFVETVARTPLWDEWGIEFVATHRTGSVTTRGLAFAAGIASFLRRILFARPAIVHLHTSLHGSFFRKSALLWLTVGVRIPVILQVHAGEFPVFYRRMPRPVRSYIRHTLARANVVVALGEGNARGLRAICPDARVMAIPNGIQIVGKRVDRRADGLHVVYLGRMCEQKGTFVLLESWAQLVADEPCLPPVRLTLAGDGEIDQVREIVARLGLGGTVDVRDWLSPAEVAELLASADVLTLPSRFEGQPMAVLEAMANGLCVVASGVGGIPDLVEDGTSAVLVPPDDVARLTQALRDVLTDQDLRARLGDAALLRARDRFDIQAVWHRFDVLYRRLGDDHEPISIDEVNA